MTFGDKMAVVFDDHDKAVPKWGDLLAEIMEDLTRLERGLADMKIECLRLEAAGMWSAVPTEMWESRNGGEAHFLRLYFPGGVKTYIGNKPEAIVESRRKAANRLRWEALDGEICDLERALRSVEQVLNRQRLVVSYRTLPDLGTTAASARPAPVPKMEVDHG